MNENELVQNQFLLYRNDQGDIKIDVLLQNETIWLTQKKMGELFGVETPAINKHINNIFSEGELREISTISKMEIVQKEGKREVKRKTTFYNLDMIIAVGYRVNSKQATQFRIWATSVLKEYIIKGFALDDERLKNGKHFGKDYFRELLERIRSIRASERRIYLQITDIFAECSIDYDPTSDTTKNFYAHVQDKFHYAIHGQTSSELVYNQADSSKENMGLQTWKNSPKGRILKSDATIGKNYLNEDQIKQLERTISSFFDYIERIVENHNTFTMENFANSVDKFLSFNEYKVLSDFGKISRQQANEKAFLEYDKFNKTQKIESDFDKLVKKIK